MQIALENRKQTKKSKFNLVKQHGECVFALISRHLINVDQIIIRKMHRYIFAFIDLKVS